MMHSSSTTQRKNKPPTTSVLTKAETPPLLGGSNSNNINNQSSATTLPTTTTNNNTTTTPPLVATVKRRKYGTSPFDENWLNLDCCGLVCACITYCLHLYGCYVVCVILLPPWFTVKGTDGVKRMTMTGRCHTLCFALIAFLAVYSHYKAMTTDPGAVPPDAEPIPDPLDDADENATTTQDGDAPPSKRTTMVGKRSCRRCHSFKPKRAHHCSICKRCIIKMDHHCPWVNNCVGIGNHKFFLLFVFYTCVSCVYSLSLVVYRVINSTGGFPEDASNLLFLVGLVVEALLFGLFTSCMMIDQYDVVMTNVTNIDRLKGAQFGFERESRDDSKASINEVFGGCGFQLHWISPWAGAMFPTSVRDEIMGFRRPCPTITEPRCIVIRNVVEELV